MKNVIFLTMLFLLIGTMLYVALHIAPDREQSYYFLEVDDIDDTVSIVYIVDFDGEVIAMIDDDLYRHGDYKNREWLRDSIETSMGFKTILECSEKYYTIIYNKYN